MKTKNYSNKIDFKKELNFIQKQISKGGPESYEYGELDDWYNNIWRSFGSGDLSIEEIEKLRSEMSKVYDNPSTMFGLVYTAPYGYKGDFEIIDRIYQGYVSKEEQLSNWDEYFQNLPAAKAVRSRKSYFKMLLEQKASLNPNLQVLNLASGPCRDLKEFYEEYQCENVEFDCVEFDPRAIEYAKDILNSPQNVNFIQQNIFKFSTQKKYDLIWSAGLFDYFDDETFIRILKRIMDYTNKTGEIVIGNFHSRNPTKNCMEFTTWRLYHRDEDSLIKLAQETGVENGKIIEAESEGVNLFMRIKNEHGS